MNSTDQKNKAQEKKLYQKAKIFQPEAEDDVTAQSNEDLEDDELERELSGTTILLPSADSTTDEFEENQTDGSTEQNTKKLKTNPEEMEPIPVPKYWEKPMKYCEDSDDDFPPRWFHVDPEDQEEKKSRCLVL